ncbi:hypothetical protein CPB83DRAFT_864230 [Crepidotus variabilis]|uniref:F-box domain-containing protein n=1 Tax=Crepidotus variabilis TaxID=179855 RepID=A0A9P6E534_9AGAR|nr:hypothetical protein CPB83DRAFT_864230 [Crepidotus variabilis]
MPEDHGFKFQLFSPEERPSCCSAAPSGPCSACERLLAVEQRIRHATTALEQALVDRQQLQNHRNSVHDPFSRLPTEVSSQIFSFCVPPSPTLDEFYEDYCWHQNPHVPYTQLTLGAVCQGWRRVAWSTASLWNFLSVRITHRTPSSFTIYVRQWLERSNRLPLTIRVAYISDLVENIDPYTLNPLMIPLIGVLNESIDRWSSVFLHIPNSYISQLKSDPTSPPNIKCLSLWSLEDKTSPPPQLFREKQDAIFNIGYLPSPSHLKITAYHLDNLHIHWGNITRFEGQYLTTEESFRVFHQSTKMTSCEMAILPHHSFASATPAAPIILRHLTVLCLLDTVTPILNQLSCPALRAISWRIDNLQLSGPAVDFITRSNCALEEIRFQGFQDHDEEDLIEFLTQVPSLKILSFERPLGRNLIDLIGETAYEQNDSVLRFLPSLQAFHYTGPRSFPWSSIPAMIPRPSSSSKDITPRPLVRLEFRIDYSSYLEDIEDTTSEELVLRDKIRQIDIENILEMLDSGISVSIYDEDDTQVIDLWARHYGLYGNDDGDTESDE